MSSSFHVISQNCSAGMIEGGGGRRGGGGGGGRRGGGRGGGGGENMNAVTDRQIDRQAPKGLTVVVHY